MHHIKEEYTFFFFFFFFLNRLTLEEGTDRLSRNVGNYQSPLRNVPEERRPPETPDLCSQSRVVKKVQLAAPPGTGWPSFSSFGNTYLIVS
jgi:hypothetical protein